MTRYLVGRGIHVPACPSLVAHIDAAVAESTGSAMPLLDFVTEVRADWQDEQQLADEGDEAVIRYWTAVEADFLMRFV